MRLTPENSPCAFASTKPSSALITSFELLASLICVMLFTGITVKGRGSITITGGTDNEGNSYVIKKQMTTKYTLCVILMELSAQIQSKGLFLDLNWRRRDRNIEADALSNGDLMWIC